MYYQSYLKKISEWLSPLLSQNQDTWARTFLNVNLLKYLDLQEV